MKHVLKALIAFAAGAVLVGCSSQPKTVGITPTKPYEIVGHSQGSSTGFMLFQVIPLNQNQRFQKAYEEALAKGGGDAVINTRISEKWFWAVVGSGYITDIEGDVIRYKK